MEAVGQPPLTKAELRKFAWVMAGALGAFALFALSRANATASGVLATITGLFLLFGLVAPAALAPVHRGWMAFAHVLGWVNTRVILGLFFFCILSPVSIVMKLTRRDLLLRRFHRGHATYWRQRDAMKAAKDSYEHLY
jgi:hypothetical protein